MTHLVTLRNDHFLVNRRSQLQNFEWDSSFENQNITYPKSHVANKNVVQIGQS